MRESAQLTAIQQEDEGANPGEFSSNDSTLPTTVTKTHKHQDESKDHVWSKDYVINSH